MTVADENGLVDGCRPAEGEAQTPRGNVAEALVHELVTGAGARTTRNFYQGSTLIADALA